MSAISIDSTRCTGCGTCADVCSSGTITVEDGIPATVPDRLAFCIDCGHCEAFCPCDALARRANNADARGAACAIGSDELGLYLRSRRSVRRDRPDVVQRVTITAILDVARYAPSGGNRQLVDWRIVHDPAEMHRLARLTIDWMRHEAASDAPLLPAAQFEPLIEAWDRGEDLICRGAPHLIVAHVPDQSAFVDWIIALTWFDVAAPSHGVGTCWAGFLVIAAAHWPPLREALALPPGRVPAHALICGSPLYWLKRIPWRKPPVPTWR